MRVAHCVCRVYWHTFVYVNMRYIVTKTSVAIQDTFHQDRIWLHNVPDTAWNKQCVLPVVGLHGKTNCKRDPSSGFDKLVELNLTTATV